MEKIKIIKWASNPIVPFCLTIVFAGLLLITLSKVASMHTSASPDKIVDNSEAEEAIWVEYEVRKGDCLAAIARDHVINLGDLIAWNKDTLTGTTLQPGQILKIKKIEWPAFTGRASWYGPGFHGRRMANNQIYDMNALLAAHKDLPLGSKIKVTSYANGKSLVLPVLDRGPYIEGRDIDLSYAAGKELGAIGPGVITVDVEPINL